MQTLYSEESLISVNRQLKKRFIVLSVVSVLLLAVFIWAMITRVQWLAMVSACLAGCFCVFFTDLFCAPILRYRRLVRSALSGRSHDQLLIYDHTEPDLSVVDGVSCSSLIFLGDPDKHGSRDILLYWDEELPRPALEPGRYYAVRYTGKNIIALQPEDPSSRL